ncbi:hypothetical protein [Streptomyces sp. UNOC14_S4]|uniref:hypothetical protein n=1 Tax=Streptomyces sp. UNOC14_S4 TaxID=2872340 RepID=UPI001E2974C1|nr:hypothetical protein [Streptomyces sp. UNOC14_S4]MCC3769472.1 hypothetical protein [Streptomyces sp. UNOC14_S4]
MTDPTTGAQAAPHPQAAPAPTAEARPTAEAQGEHPAGPRPLGADRAPTGEPAVDTALARLADADHLDVNGHLAVYEDVHGDLREALAALDRAPGPSGAPTPMGSPASYDTRS